MAWIHPLYQEHQRKRWLRHDWQRFLSPAERAEQQRAEEVKLAAQRKMEEAALEQAAFEQEVLQIRRDLADLKFELALRRFRRKYSPDQPRVPKGNPEGGQWTRGGSIRIRLAGDITGFTKHGINQAITRGVSPSALHEAVTNPIEILPQSNDSVRYVGRGAVVVLNPLGQVITTWRK